MPHWKPISVRRFKRHSMGLPGHSISAQAARAKGEVMMVRFRSSLGARRYTEPCNLSRGRAAVQPVALALEAFVHARLGFLAAVVPGAEPQIERDQAVAAVIDLEILVMEVVRIGVAVECDALGELEPVEADVAVERAEAGEMQLVQADDRVRRD